MDVVRDARAGCALHGVRRPQRPSLQLIARLTTSDSPPPLHPLPVTATTATTAAAVAP